MKPQRCRMNSFFVCSSRRPASLRSIFSGVPMPVTLPPLTRRTFLARPPACSSSAALARAADADPHRVALLSDSHIGEKPENDRPRLQHGRPAEAGRGGGREARPRSRRARSSTATSPTRPAPPPSTSCSRSSSNRSARPASRCTSGLGNHDNFTRFAEGLAQAPPEGQAGRGQAGRGGRTGAREPVRARLLRPEEHGRRAARRGATEVAGEGARRPQDEAGGGVRPPPAAVRRAEERQVRTASPTAPTSGRC